MGGGEREAGEREARERWRVTELWEGGELLELKVCVCVGGVRWVGTGDWGLGQGSVPALLLACQAIR